MTTAETPTAQARGGGAYVQAGSVHTYYEVTGTGDPLVLLRGPSTYPPNSW